MHPTGMHSCFLYRNVIHVADLLFGKFIAENCTEMKEIEFLKAQLARDARPFSVHFFHFHAVFGKSYDK